MTKPLHNQDQPADNIELTSVDTHSKVQQESKLDPQLSQRIREFFNNPEQGVIKFGDVDEAPSTFLGYFGLKTPDSLRQFLKTPAGKTVLEEMREEIILEEAIAEKRAFEQREHDLLMRRIKIAIFLWILEKEEYLAEQSRAIIQEQIASTMNYLQKTNTTASTTSNTLPEHQRLYNSIAQYNEAIEELNNKKVELQNEEAFLNSQFSAFETQEQEMDAKYSLFEKHASEEDFNTFFNEDGSIQQEKIEAIHAQLAAEMEELYVKISEHVDNDWDATLLLDQQNALNLRYANLSDLLDIHSGDKFYANADGERVKTSQEALFILNKGETIVFDDNQYLLLKPGQDRAAVKDSPELREQAKNYFERKKTDIMSVKNVVTHNKGIEQTQHQERVFINVMSRAANKAEQIILENQIRQLQSGRAAVQQELTQLNPQMTPSSAQGRQEAPVIKPTVIPTPTVTSKPQTTKLSSTPAPRPAMGSYQAKIENLLNNAQPITKDLLTRLATLAPNANRTAARLYLQSLFNNGTNFSIATPEQRQALLIKMQQFGVVSPIMEQRNESLNPQLQAESHRSPTALNMTPNPFKEQ